MVASRTRATPRSTRAPWRALLDSDLTAGLLAAAVALLVGALVLRAPSRVDELVVVNDSELDLAVQARSDDGGGWIAIAEAPRRSRATAAEVLDLGDVWVFRFTAQGHRGAEVQVSRTELEASGWTLVVPPQVEAGLLRDGAVAPP